MFHMFHIGFSFSLLKKLCWVKHSRSGVKRMPWCKWDYLRVKVKFHSTYWFRHESSKCFWVNTDNASTSHSKKEEIVMLLILQECFCRHGFTRRSEEILGFPLLPSSSHQISGHLLQSKKQGCGSLNLSAPSNIS